MTSFRTKLSTNFQVNRRSPMPPDNRFQSIVSQEEINAEHAAHRQLGNRIIWFAVAIGGLLVCSSVAKLARGSAQPLLFQFPLQR